ncbi:MAG: RIO1 family regulatory kinase/ATPase [Thermoplasmata archaeon]
MNKIHDYEKKMLTIIEKDYHLHKPRIISCERKDTKAMITRPYIIGCFEDDKTKKTRKYFVKLITEDSIYLWKLMQFAKNVYLIFSAKDAMFDIFTTPLEMAVHEYRRLNMTTSVNLPTPKVYGINKIADNAVIIVMEALENVRNLDKSISDDILNEVFSYLRIMHNADILHGDIKLSNILFSNKIYFIDSGLFIDYVNLFDAKMYDLACTICALVPIATVARVLNSALRFYSNEEMLASCEFLSLAQRRPTFAISNEQINEIRRIIEQLRNKE